MGWGRISRSVGGLGIGCDWICRIIKKRINIVKLKKEEFPCLALFSRYCFHQKWNRLSISPFEVARYSVHDGEEHALLGLVREIDFIFEHVENDQDMSGLLYDVRFNLRTEYYGKSAIEFMEELVDFIKYVAINERGIFLGEPSRSWGSPFVSGVVINSAAVLCLSELPCTVKFFETCFLSDCADDYYLGYMDKSIEYFRELSKDQYLELNRELKKIFEMTLSEDEKKMLLYGGLGLRYNLDYYNITTEIFLKSFLNYMSYDIEG